MKKITTNFKEEDNFLQELCEEEIKDLDNGGMCLFIKHCIILDQYTPVCPGKAMIASEP
ncbi:MAG: hypothetical protein KH355_02430 [Clostridiales bacterium]|nr:hypothetical protein [Clostridiales bacterium]